MYVHYLYFMFKIGRIIKFIQVRVTLRSGRKIIESASSSDESDKSDEEVAQNRNGQKSGVRVNTPSKKAQAQPKKQRGVSSILLSTCFSGFLSSVLPAFLLFLDFFLIFSYPRQRCKWGEGYRQSPKSKIFL